MTESAQPPRSKNGVPIRLPDERWSHIMEEHGELEALRDAILLTIAQPEKILAGSQGELLAIREVEPEKWLVVVYREGDRDASRETDANNEIANRDGFVITAFLTRRYRSLDRRMQLWP